MVVGPVAFVVDNDREFRARVSVSLRRDGFRVRTFSGPRAAFARVVSVLTRAISAVPRRVILLHLHADDLAGLTLLSSVRDAFIVVSSLRDRTSRARATDLGTLAIAHRRDTRSLARTLQRFWCADVDRCPVLS